MELELQSLWSVQAMPQAGTKKKRGDGLLQPSPRLRVIVCF